MTGKGSVHVPVRSPVSIDITYCVVLSSIGVSKLRNSCLSEAMWFQVGVRGAVKFEKEFMYCGAGIAGRCGDGVCTTVRIGTPDLADVVSSVLSQVTDRFASKSGR